MAKQRTQWGGIVEGEIVNFRYKGKKQDAKSRNRTCLILNMRHMYARNDGKEVRLAPDPEKVVADCPRLIYPRPSSFIVLRILKIFGESSKKQQASSTCISSIS